MRIKINRHAWKLILLFSLMHFLMSMFYAYYCLGNDFYMQEDFLEILMGGIRVQESGNLFCVMLYVIPRCMFCVYVANVFMRDLKTNFVYIFLRTSKRELWLRSTVLKTALSILCYESFFGILVLATKAVMWKDMQFSIWPFVTMLIMEFLQLLMLVLFSNVLLLFMSETASIFGTLLELAAPIVVTGVVFDNNGAWQYPAKWIPFNLGNYNYMSSCHVNLLMTGLGILILCIAIYIFAAWRIKKYELI